jgi:flagellar biosynthesis/type III secretory pathway chaperone
MSCPSSRAVQAPPASVLSSVNPLDDMTHQMGRQADALENIADQKAQQAGSSNSTDNSLMSIENTLQSIDNTLKSMNNTLKSMDNTFKLFCDRLIEMHGNISSH